MNINTKSVVSMLIASMMVLAAVSMGALAAPTITDDSDLEDEDLVYIDPSGDDVEDLVFDFDTTDPIDVTVTDVAEDDEETDTQLLALTDISDADEGVTVDGTEYTVDVDHADLANEADREVGDTYAIDVEITDGTDTQTITLDGTMVSTADESVVLVDDETDLGPTVDVEEASDGFFGFGADDHDTFEASNNHPNGDQNYNTVTYKFDGDAADAYSDSSSLTTGDNDVVYGMTAFVQGEHVLIYEDSAGDLHDEGDSYAVYDTDSDELTVEFGDDREDALSTDVTVVNNDIGDEVGFGTLMDEHGFESAMSLSFNFELF